MLALAFNVSPRPALSAEICSGLKVQIKVQRSFSHATGFNFVRPASAIAASDFVLPGADFVTGMAEFAIGA